MPEDQKEDPVFYDTLFRQKRKQSRYRIVDAPALGAPVADTHAHLQLLADPAFALARSAAHDVSFVCTIVDMHEDGDTTFRQLDDWLWQAQASLPMLMAQPYPEVPHVRIITGCHPHNAKHYNDALEETLRRHLADPRVSAVGEIGLDFHYDYSPRDQQRLAFRRQLRLAKECGLPAVLHVREAHEDAFAIMQDEGFPEAGVLLHCFNLDWATLEPWVQAGCYVAFGGPLTFKKSDDTREAAAKTPVDRLLTETDAPFMTPEPLRGMVCGPEHVVFTAERMAQVCAEDSPEAQSALLRQLMANARSLLDRAPTTWQKEATQAHCRNKFAACEGGSVAFADELKEG